MRHECACDFVWSERHLCDGTSPDCPYGQYTPYQTFSGGGLEAASTLGLLAHDLDNQHKLSRPVGIEKVGGDAIIQSAETAFPLQRGR